MIKYSLTALQEFFSMPAKTTPVDADVLLMGDSADPSLGIVKVTWANLKATILTAVAAVGYAPLNSPIFTNAPSLPTGTIAVTQPAEDNSTKVATTEFTKTKSEGVAIGVGQTWQNVTATRESGTTYTNSTGKAIAVNFQATVVANTTIYMTINGIAVPIGANGTGAANFAIGSIIIPPSATYVMSGGITVLNNWYELR